MNVRERTWRPRWSIRVKDCEQVPHWNRWVGMELGGARGEAICDQTTDIVLSYQTEREAEDKNSPGEHL